MFAAVAAWRAKAAREQAKLAEDAAIRLGRGAQVNDLVADLQELQSLLARSNLPAIADKCGRLKGRVAGFQQEAYNDLSVEARRNLSSVLAQLEIIAKVATETEPVKEDEKLAGIQTAYRQLEVALNSVSGEHRRKLRGGSQWRQT